MHLNLELFWLLSFRGRDTKLVFCEAASHQKLGIILENKVIQKIEAVKTCQQKIMSAKIDTWKIDTKIGINFDIENWFWKSEFCTFWLNSLLHQFTKYNSFLLEYRFVAQNLSNFVSLPRKFDNWNNSNFHTSQIWV